MLVSVFDKVSKLKLSRFTAQYSSCNLQNVIFRKAKIMQKRKEQVMYFLRATSEGQSGLFVYQITLKGCRMPQSYHSLWSKNILKICYDTEGKNSRKSRGIVLHYHTTRRSLFSKSSHNSNCSNNYVWLKVLITIFNFQ